MKNFRKFFAAFLFFLTVFTAVFAITSCSTGNVSKTEIRILSEANFNAGFEKLADGAVKIAENVDNLAEEEHLTEGERYYAVLLLSYEKLSTGWIEFKGGITLEDGVLISAETGDNFTVERDLPLRYSVKSKNEKEKSDFYAAFPFTVNSYESVNAPFVDASGILHTPSDEKLSVEFLTYETVRGDKKEKKISIEKEIRHSKYVSSLSSVKYLRVEDYRNGYNEDTLKDTLEIAVGEKCYAVIDYKLSDYVGIGELDTLLATITAKSDDGAVFKLKVEDIPSPDYTEQNDVINATVKIHPGTEQGKGFRFIVSLVAERAGSIKISSSVFDSKISVIGDRKAEGSINVNGSLTLESKLDYKLSDDGKYYIVVGLGAEYGDTVTVPSTYKGKSVKAIADNVFANVPYLKEIFLPEGLETIGANAFGGENEAKYIVIPSTVTAVGSGAFDGWSDKYIYCEAEEKPSAFDENWAPSDANIIWDHVESHFSLNNDGKSYTLVMYTDGKRERINVPETYRGLPVTGIADTAFMICDKVKYLHISRYVTEISFSSHSNLEELTVDSRNTVYKCSGDCLIDTRDGTLVSGGNNSVIPTDGSVTKIGDKAFYGCEQLTEINIPASVISIGNEAFYDCEALSSVAFAESCSLESIGASAFKYCVSLTEIIIPVNVAVIEISAFENCYLLESVTLGNKLTEIKYRAFYNCTALTEINYMGGEQDFTAVTKGDDWDCYDNNGVSEKIGYTLNLNYTGE